MGSNQTAAGISSWPLSHVSTASRSMPALRVTPRGVQIALGVFWILDGLLQFQPYSFSQNFLSQTIGSLASGQPGPIQWTINTAVHIAMPYRVEVNLLFALIQL